jgi:UDP-glucose 4-epimerase
VVSIFAKKIKEMQELIIYGDGNQKRDFVNVSDVADASILAATATEAVGKCINIGTGRSVSLNDVVKILEELTGKKLNVKYMPERKGEIRNSCADITLARKILGYEPKVSLRDGLKEILSV